MTVHRWCSHEDYLGWLERVIALKLELKRVALACIHRIVPHLEGNVPDVCRVVHYLQVHVLNLLEFLGFLGKAHSEPVVHRHC